MPISKKIYLASDHAGFHLKEEIKHYLDRVKIPYEDIGNTKYQATDDYPDFAYRAAQRVAKGRARGIMLCHNGVGVCIVANKVKGVRAVNASSVTVARESRRDDDTNVLCLGGEHVSITMAKKIIKAWLETSFSRAKRHRRRVDTIKRLESKKH